VPVARGIDLQNPHKGESQHPLGRNSHPNDNVAESKNNNSQTNDNQTIKHPPPIHDHVIQAQKPGISVRIDPLKSGNDDDDHAKVTPQASPGSAVTVPPMMSSPISPVLPSSTASLVISATSKELAALPTGSSYPRSNQPPSPVWTAFPREDQELPPEKMSIDAEIDCRIVVYLGEIRLPGSDDVKPIPWLATGQYSRIRNKIERRIKNKLKESNGSRPWPKLHEKSAHVKLLERKSDGTETRLEEETVNHRDYWVQKVPIIIARHGSQTPFSTERLLLEVDWRFDIVDIYGQEGTTLAEKVNNLVVKKLQKNWRSQSFLPRTDLNAIFSEEIIEELINNDNSVSEFPLHPSNPKPGEPLNRWTSKWIFLNATGLLATWIWARIDLKCLHQLVVDHEKSDVDRPWEEVPPGVSHSYFQALTENQKTFWVYDFDAKKLKSNMEKGKYEVIENWQTIPIIAKGKLGQGGFGLVTEVSIHPDYHTFEEVS